MRYRVAHRRAAKRSALTQVLGPMTKLTRYLYIAVITTALAIPAAWLIVQRTDAFDVASTFVKNSSEVHSRLGEIQDIDLSLFGYSWRVVGARGDANFNLKVRGSLASATAYVELTRQGTWRPVLGRLVLQDGNSIDLTP